ncbi:hypothetical protein WN55_10029 [Dufourea novaeangliae]|uniref:Uncharacterized protein n=1 Tax=Dufourea novaeangliae TaxID=178035 RepID=A0A154PAA5_DUFNO|nr:hypothetical protein WN55_10029 [Dufourea novaeangliae]
MAVKNLESKDQIENVYLDCYLSNLSWEKTTVIVKEMMCNDDTGKLTTSTVAFGTHNSDSSFVNNISYPSF